MTTSRRALAAAGMATIWAIVAAAAVLAAVTSFSALAGYRSYTVLTGSMEPSLEVGSIVIDERVSPLEARPGDVITFPDPDNHDRLITHRLKRVTVEADTAHMVTQGDANDAPERWSVALDAQLGRVAVHLPKLGYARALVSGTPGRVAVLLLLVAWGVLSLIDVWRPEAAEPAPQLEGGAA